MGFDQYLVLRYLSSSIAVRRKQLEHRDFICACPRCVDEVEEVEGIMTIYVLRAL